MAIETLRDVYRHQLGESYHAEQQVLTLLNTMELEASTSELRDHIRGLRQQTLRGTANLERCFELAGTAAPKVESGIVQGVVADRGRFLEEQPSAGALETYNAHTIARLAALKRESYRQLGRLAAQVGQDDARRLLGQSLTELEALHHAPDDPVRGVPRATRPAAAPISG